MLRDNSQRADIATKVFWAIALVNTIAVISGYFEYELLIRIRDGLDYTDAEAESNDLRQMLIGLAQSVLYIASMVVFIQWMRRAYYNLAQARYVSAEDKDSWVIWSFAIPFYNLYRPYQIAKEILVKMVSYLNRRNPDNRLTYSTTILGFWWACFLISNVFNRFAFKSAFKDNTIDQIVTSSGAYLLSDSFDVIAVVVTAYMIKYVSSFESMFFFEANAELLEAEHEAETEKESEKLKIENTSPEEGSIDSDPKEEDSSEEKEEDDKS